MINKSGIIGTKRQLYNSRYNSMILIVSARLVNELSEYKCHLRLEEISLELSSINEPNEPNLWKQYDYIHIYI